MHIWVYTHAYMYVCPYIHILNMWMYTCMCFMHASLHTYRCVHTYLFLSCVYVLRYMYTYVQMYIHMCMHVCTSYEYVCSYLHIYMLPYTHIWINTYTHISIHLHVCLLIYTPNIYISMAYIHTYTDIHVYIHTFNHNNIYVCSICIYVHTYTHICPYISA